jgi:hypothetical protein
MAAGTIPLGHLGPPTDVLWLVALLVALEHRKGQKLAETARKHVPCAKPCAAWLCGFAPRQISAFKIIPKRPYKPGITGSIAVPLQCARPTAVDAPDRTSAPGSQAQA